MTAETGLAEIQTLTDAIRQRWPESPSRKAQGYVGKFVKRRRTGPKISARVEGNYGMYTVSIKIKDDELRTACSCYVGKEEGFCHHCVALGFTFLNDPDTFEEVQVKERVSLKSLDDLASYLGTVTLNDVIVELKAQGITQQALAASLGMNPQHLSAIKSSELKNRYFNELGATKLACLWVLEHVKPPAKKIKT